MSRSYKLQRGVAAVEFALIAVVLISVLVAVIELGRLMFVFNSAVHATTLAARWSAVCNGTAAAPAPSAPVARRAQEILPRLSQSGALQIQYLGKNDVAGCDGTATAPCYRVRASLSPELLVENFSTPLLSGLIRLPTFTTTVTSEGLVPVGDSAYPSCAS